MHCVSIFSAHAIRRDGSLLSSMMFECDDGEYSAQAEPHGTQRLNQLKRIALSQVSSLRDSSSMAFTGENLELLDWENEHSKCWL